MGGLLNRLNAGTRLYCELGARVSRAFGHPTRLFIVQQLAHGRRSVLELTEMTDSDASTISKHLTVLKNAGVVASEKEGSKVDYRLRVSPRGGLFTCMEEVAETIVDAVASSSR